jgi:lipopolysaccharide/colanic/teichoic acid biosynthesis glycosyltransferase
MSKRLVDIVVSVAGLVVLAPLMLVIALAVKLDSAGPALYRQVRVGREGRPFEILKFRSMADQGGCAETGALVTAGDDPRITRVGAFLRRWKLDELPQLVNVLTGEMSLVGPRPEVPRYVAMYPPDARREILSVRPGITDDAAIEFRNESDLLAGSNDPERTYIEEILPRKLEHYRSYVRGRTMVGDLRVLLHTLSRIVTGG